MISCSCLGHRDYGRFGNQLFQYSLSKILAHIHDTTFHLNPDNHFLKFFDQKCLTYKKLEKPCKAQYIEKNSFYFDNQIFNHREIDLIGFFQNINYYIKHLEIIKQEFKPNPIIINKTYRYLKQYTNKIENSICLHFRRKDYKILQNLYGFLDVSYYMNIIAKLDYDKIFIVSDDISLIKSEFMQHKITNTNIHFVDDLDVYHEFFIIYLCRISIMANSSFSWWASLLSDNKDKKIYYPEPWIIKNHNGDKLPKVELFLPHWEKQSSSAYKWHKLFNPLNSVLS